MGIIKVSDNVYSVGVINPSLRVFDIIMESKYGTSYNAYFIAGKKNVLVETVHEDYFDEYIYNVSCLVDISDIDYIVMNHTELDHSGSLIKLLKINPNITVVCTAAAEKYLKSIINMDFKCKTVKHKEKIEIGPNSNIEFIVAPLLHWPDSMMTYLESDNILFSCDFLGAHFCEPSMLEENIHYKKEYMNEFKYYYNCIFGPFKPYVLAGLDKIKDLEISAICPSHGPIITKGISDRINDYRKWSTKSPKPYKSLAIIYASAYGCTKELAETAYKTLSEKTQIKPTILDIVSTPMEEVAEVIENCDALVVASCTINRDAPKLIWDALSRIDAINSRTKYAGAIGSYGWSGEAVDMIKNRLSMLNFKFIGDGIKVLFKPRKEDLQKVSEYIMEIANKLQQNGSN